MTETTPPASAYDKKPGQDPNAPEPTPPMGFPDAPPVRTVGFEDLHAAFWAGVADFRAAPQFGLFFGGVYTLGGLLLLACVAYWDTPWAIIPLAVAFPLIGPFVAVGLYDVSRRLTSGQPLSWSSVLGVVFRQKDRQLAWMGFVMLFIFWMWAYQIRLLLAIFLGSASLSSIPDFMQMVVTTENGLGFLATGTVIGAGLALFLFSVTVISMPLLVDRDVDFITAIVTSVTAVRRAPSVMIGWGAFVLAAMLLALLPAFLGLLVVLPVLGHATWRLYERAVVRS